LTKFKGQFDMGWDKYREQTRAPEEAWRHSQAAKLTPRPVVLPAWDSLNTEQKRIYAHEIEVFAGYGAYVDARWGACSTM
jgi:arylsulfatase A-like enzyme